MSNIESGSSLEVQDVKHPLGDSAPEDFVKRIEEVDRASFSRELQEKALALLAEGVAVFNKWRLVVPWEEIDFRGCNFEGRDLQGALFFRTNLEGCNFRGARLSGANLAGARLAVSDLADADLQGAVLRYADFTASNLKHADLSGADLTLADFTGANLDQIDVTSCEYAKMPSYLRERSGTER